jgi:hypothetical protein
MSAAREPDVDRLICGNIDDLKNYLACSAGSDLQLLERALAACNGREVKTKRRMLEAAIKRLRREQVKKGRAS